MGLKSPSIARPHSCLGTRKRNLPLYSKSKKSPSSDNAAAATWCGGWWWRVGEKARRGATESQKERPTSHNTLYAQRKK